MNHYQVSLHGENFWLEMEGKPSRMSFFTNRYVIADNEEDAENSAVQMLREDPKLKNRLNDSSDPPVIYCDSITAIEAFDPSTVVQHGFSFYPEESDK